MPRDANGNFTLPAGNPVVTGTTIESAWANTTMDDIKQGLTDSLDRYGRGGMQAPFRFVDGTAGAPGMSWASELSTGFYRAGAADMRATVAGVPQMRWTNVGVDVWDSVAADWKALTSAAGANFALLNATNVFTTDQRIQATAGTFQIWKDASPTFAVRLSINLDLGNSLGLAYYDDGIGSWRAKFISTTTTSFIDNDTITLRSADAATRRAGFTLNGLQVGNNAYAPTTGATRYIGVTAEAGNLGEIGVYANDGTNNPRVAMFASGTTLGLDWTYSSGISQFEFRRDGATIFTYTSSGVDIYYGKTLRVFSTDMGSAVTLQQDTAGFAFWNTQGGNTGFQWYRAGVLCATLTAVSLQLGRNTTLNIRNAIDYGVTISSLAGPAGIYYSSNATYPHYFQIDGTNAFGITAIDIGAYAGRELRLYKSDNSTYSSLKQVSDNGGTNQMNLASRGAVMHWNSSSLVAGDITISLTAPAPSGGRHGQMVLVYE